MYLLYTCRELLEEIHFLLREALDRRAEVHAILCRYIYILSMGAPEGYIYIYLVFICRALEEEENEMY